MRTTPATNCGSLRRELTLGDPRIDRLPRYTLAIIIIISSFFFLSSNPKKAQGKKYGTTKEVSIYMPVCVCVCLRIDLLFPIGTQCLLKERLRKGFHTMLKSKKHSEYE